MADTKISALPVAVTLAGTEKVLAVQGGANVAMTTGQMVDLASTTVNAYLAQAIALFNAQLGTASAPFSRFVDGITGSDAGGSYDGTTPAKAWKTSASVIALGTAIAGVPIGYARGSVFYGQLLLTATNVRLGGYGDPALGRPIFDSSIQLSNASFTADGTYAKQWNIAVTGMLADAKNIGNGLYRDAATGKHRIFKQYASKAAMFAAGGDGFYFSGWGSASGTATIQLASGSPVTSGVEYRLAPGIALEINGTGAVVTDMIFRNNGAQDGSLKISQPGGVIRRVEVINGARHNLYAQFDCTIEDSAARGGDNQLEGGQGGNGFVINQPDMTGHGFTARRNISDCAGYGGFTSWLCHDSTAGHLAGPILLEDDIHIGVATGYATVSTLTTIRRPVFKVDPIAGIVPLVICGISAPGDVKEITNASGVVNRAVDGSAAGTARFIGSNLTVPDLGGGNIGYYRVASSTGDIAIQSTNETLTIAPTSTNPNGALKPIAYVQRGSFAVNGSKFQLGNGETIGHDLTHGWYGGFSGGTFVPSGGGAVWAYGLQFYVGGTTYATLAAAQAAGYEAGSTQQMPNAPIRTANLAVADQNLEAVSPWTLTSGTAATLGIRSNKIAVLLNATANYKLGDHFTSGVATFSGTEGAVIPAGTAMTIGAVAYVSTAAAMVVNGKAAVPVAAVVAGTTGNAAAGTAIALTGGLLGIVSPGALTTAAQAGGAIEFDSAVANMGNMYVTMKMADDQNFIGVRSTATAYIVTTRIAGTFSQIVSTTAVTPTPGDKVMLAARVVDASTGKLLVTLHVNDRVLAINTVTSPALAAATGYGVFVFGGPLNPAIAGLRARPL